ncbi:hypothetical protein LI328DRAFT_168558 [Trichoderma asperelloides]|nr:hypothetical protein LI328DRAFT_168558 [Trichoderma asperelloides]
MTKETRPEISPYAVPSIELYFQGGSTLYIPPHLLTQSHSLGSMVLQSTLQFTDVSADAGHVLVHYLFTGTYQSLKLKRSSAQDCLAAEFLTSVRVYSVAQTYTLPPLVELAKNEIQKLGKNLPTALIFDLVKDAHLSLRTDDIWLSSYLKAQLRLFLESPLKPSAGIKAEDQATIPIMDLLFKSMFELYHENIISLRETQSHAFEQASTNTTKLVEEQAAKEVEEATREAETKTRKPEEQTVAPAALDVTTEEEKELAMLESKKAKKGRLLKTDEARRLELRENAKMRAKEKVAQEAEQAAAKESEAQAVREDKEAVKEATERAGQKDIEAKVIAEVAEEECEIARLLDKKHNSFMGLSSKLEKRLSQLQAKAIKRAEKQGTCESEYLTQGSRKETAAIAHPETTHELYKQPVENEALTEDKMIQKDSALAVGSYGSWGIGEADAIKNDEIHVEAQAAQDIGISTSQDNVANAEPLGATPEKEKKTKKKKKNKSVAAVSPTPEILEDCLLEKTNRNTKNESNMELDPWGFSVREKRKAENKKSDVKPSASRSPSGDLTDTHNQEAAADEYKMARLEDEGWRFWGLGKNKKAESNTATAGQESVLPLPLPPRDPKVLGIQIDSGLA